LQKKIANLGERKEERRNNVVFVDLSSSFHDMRKSERKGKELALIKRLMTDLGK